MRKLFFLRRKCGFTLIELIVVIAILGILAAVLVPSIGSYVNKAKVNKAANEISKVISYGVVIITELIYEDTHNLSEMDEFELNMILIDALLSDYNMVVDLMAPNADAQDDMVYVYYDKFILTASYYEGQKFIMSKEKEISIF